MTRLYACIISPDIKRDRERLLAIADGFASSIEVMKDGILFDVSGLERLMGKPEQIAKKIRDDLTRSGLSGSIAVAETVDTAMLLARQRSDDKTAIHLSDKFEHLPLSSLNIEQDMLNVFSDLGLRNVRDLFDIPHDELIGRYGRGFQNVIDTIEQKGRSFLTPNIKEDQASWRFELDQPVENFEQLIFVANHGLERLFARAQYCGFSCEHIDLHFDLKNKTKRSYEVKISFPTLTNSFWLKLINLRVALDPPEASIVSINIVAHFAKARPGQLGLYTAARPEPESLLLTVSKLKKLVGETNVGIPKVLNERLPEPFILDATDLPEVSENSHFPRSENSRISQHHGVIAFSYYRPPVRAEIVVEDGRLVFIKARDLSGHVTEYSGVWKANSAWWKKPWKTQEWDIEVENNGIYRLAKTPNEWLLIGEYD